MSCQRQRVAREFEGLAVVPSYSAFQEDDPSASYGYVSGDPLAHAIVGNGPPIPVHVLVDENRRAVRGSDYVGAVGSPKCDPDHDRSHYRLDTPHVRVPTRPGGLMAIGILIGRRRRVGGGRKDPATRA